MKDHIYMRRALALARRGLGATHPNPLVGAVVVASDKVVGQGWHETAGGLHAEVIALEDAGERARNGVLYVTLEPCNHSGRTGPCVDAIIRAGVRRVVIGTSDPNPHVPGGGSHRLREHGVEVTEEVLGVEARELNIGWLHWIRTGFPFVVLKLALTLDSMVSAERGRRTNISGPIANAFTHRLRSTADAILVGVNTVLIDDPLLTNRSGRGKIPLRVVADSNLRTPPEAQIFRSPGSVLLVTTALEQGHPAAAEVLRFPYEGRVPLREMLLALGGRGVQLLLCEGGAEMARSLLEARLVHRLLLFVAPEIAGPQGLPLFSNIVPFLACRRVRRIDRDVMIDYAVDKDV